MGSVFGKIGEETPKFELESTHECQLTGDDGESTLVKFEIRKYAPNLEVTTPMPMDSSKNQGSSFMTLAKYIGVATRTPANHDPKDASKRDFVSMTAPVVQRPGDRSTGMMSFVLPSSLTAETAPIPTNPEVQVKKMPGRRMAVLQFNGNARPKDERVARKASELKQALEKCALPAPESDEWELYSYNPPWSIPYFKTNEVAFCLAEPVAESAVGGVVVGEKVKEEVSHDPEQQLQAQ
jgi:hypothetical protein